MNLKDVIHNAVLAEQVGIGALVNAISDGEPVCDVAIQLGSANRIVFVAVGKSAHVARKIAATFTSLGMAAVFVHAGEASHGDLGMIQPTDVVVMLSKSGDTRELGPVIDYCLRFGVTTIGITCTQGSLLHREVDIPLIVPEHAEAIEGCPAPTTSTTQMLVLGDALAAGALQVKGGLSNDQFRIYHPGGKIGASLMKVIEAMKGRRPPICSRKALHYTLAERLTQGGYGCLAVVDDDDKLIGIVTDGDYRRSQRSTNNVSYAEEIMTPNPIVVRPETPLSEAVGVMSEKKITALIVVDNDNRPIGVLHIHDCLDAGVI